MSPRNQLLRERAAIHGSISHIDDVISQAQATRAVLGSQRALFGDVQGKVKLLGDKFPKEALKGYPYSVGSNCSLYVVHHHLLAFKREDQIHRKFICLISLFSPHSLTHSLITDQSIPSIKSEKENRKERKQERRIKIINIMSASSTSSFSPDQQQQLSSNTDQLCYVHCNFCDTVLAVSVPCTSLFKTVTVRCGHCTNLLSVNMRGLLLPSSNQLHLPHSFFTPQNLLEEIRNAPSSNMMMNHHQLPNPNDLMMSNIRGGSIDQETPKPTPPAARPPEKRQRVPSAYNRFIKDEIQRIKAGNPDISHREAFSAAAKNWAHFPHIHFGLMPDHQPVKKANVRQEAEDVLMKDGFFSPANVGVSPY
ncbi:hypothetical protein Ahy_A02g006391 isoform B [Arachis hypogaea]|nr:hypothetical protein Ahy_A02g006391 isoform B [Arachis hypogaea]